MRNTKSPSHGDQEGLNELHWNECKSRDREKGVLVVVRLGS